MQVVVGCCCWYRHRSARLPSNRTQAGILTFTPPISLSVRSNGNQGDGNGNSKCPAPVHQKSGGGAAPRERCTPTSGACACSRSAVPPSPLPNPPADPPPRPPVRAPLCAVNGNLNQGDFNGNKNGNFNKGDLNGNGGCALPVHQKRSGGGAAPRERHSPNLLAPALSPQRCAAIPAATPAPLCGPPSPAVTRLPSLPAASQHLTGCRLPPSRPCQPSR